MNKEEVFDDMLEVTIGYAQSMGTSLWMEVQQDQARVCPGYGMVVVDWLTMV
jgi:hypothetical protein